jgi:hypothetical protein
MLTYPKFPSPSSIVRPVEAELPVEADKIQETGEKAESDIEPDDSDLVPNGQLHAELETDVIDEEQIQAKKRQAAAECGEFMNDRGEAGKVLLQQGAGEESDVEERVDSDIRIGVDGRSVSMKNGVHHNSGHVTTWHYRKLPNVGYEKQENDEKERARMKTLRNTSTPHSHAGICKPQFHIRSPRPECGHTSSHKAVKPHNISADESDNRDRSFGSPDMVGSRTCSPNISASPVHKSKKTELGNEKWANDARMESSTPLCGRNRSTDFIYPLPEEGENLHTFY